MLLATTEQQLHNLGLRPRPDIPVDLAGFEQPRDVLDARHLDADEKRAILASWISDASAVQDQPQLRWLLGTPAPVAVADIRDALVGLDQLTGGLQ